MQKLFTTTKQIDTKKVFQTLDFFIYETYQKTDNWKYNFPFYYLRFSRDGEKLFCGNIYYSKDNFDISDSLLKKITQQLPKYYFLYDSKNKKLKNPEELQRDDITHIKKILKKDPEDFYALSAFLIYGCNTGDLYLEPYFQKFFSIDPYNEHMLARYARYLASSQYKLAHHPKFLEKASNVLDTAIENKQLMEPYLLSWRGLILYELGDYKGALRYYQTAKIKNKKYAILNPEILFWEAKVYFKLGNYKKSLHLCEQVFKNFTHKISKDFRVFQLCTHNLVIMGDINAAKRYLEDMFDAFLKTQEIYLMYGGKKYFLHTEKKLYFKDIFLKHRYESFYLYNRHFYSGKYENIFLNLGFFYKEKLLGAEVEFMVSRGIEEVCFLFLQKTHEKTK